MTRIIILFAALLISVQFQAQEIKDLTLSDAILKQRSDLAPKSVSGITWISADLFAARNDDKGITIRNTKGKEVHNISVSDLNVVIRKAGLDTLKSVRPYTWMNGHMILKLASSLYIYDYKANDMVLHLEIPADAKHLTFSDISGNLAYTIGQNVFVSTPNGKHQVTALEAEGVSAGIAIHRSEFGIVNGLFWSEEGMDLGFYEMDERMVTDYPLADYDTKPGKVDLIKYPMAGQASHHAKVGVYSVQNDKMVYLNTGVPLDQYLTNFTFSPTADKAYVVIINRDQNHAKLNAYSTMTGELERTLFEEKHDKYVEPEHPPIFPPNSESFVWFSERDGFNHLYHFDAEGTEIAQLTMGDFVVKSIIGFSSDGNQMIIEATKGTMGEAIYNVDIAKAQMTKLTSEHGSYRGYMGDGDGLILSHQSTEIGNKTGLYNLKGKEIATLIDSENPLKNYNIGEVELPVLATADGTQLQARLIKPFDFDANKKYPVVVYVYGGPHAQLITDNYRYGASMWMYEMANRGYLVFTVDGRGSANRGLEFEQAIFRNVGDVEMEDQLTGVEYLKSLDYVDADRMAVHGWSYGGFMTTSLMLRNPGVFQVGVAGGPVTDWSLYEIMYGERYMDSPAQNPKGYAKSELKGYVKNLEGKLLLIHGLDDNVVVPQHAYNLIEAFVDAGVQMDFFTYPGHPHNVRGKDRVHLMTKVLDYIEDALK